jgi:hypothetical protein
MVIFIALGVDYQLLLILFNIAVMSTVATFSPNKMSLWFLLEGATVVTISSLIGCIVSFYIPAISGVIIIVYGSLAFFIPKYKDQSNIFVIGALVYSVSTISPLTFVQASTIGLYSLILIIVLLVVYYLYDNHIIYNKHNYLERVYNSQRYTLGLISLSSLLLAFCIISYLKNYNISHLYWVNITILAILQSSSEGTIRKTAFTRITMNAVGAFITIFVMSYIMPETEWINMVFLLLLLFGIFSLGYSYAIRILLIEIFVLTITHLLGQYNHILSIDRLLLTLLGGSLVFITGYFVIKLTKLKEELN